MPKKGFNESVEAHNVMLDALVEWVEGSITFGDEEITQIDLIDILLEEEVYRKQDFAKERLDSAWPELIRRQKILGSYCPFNVKGVRVRRTRNWRDTPAYAFCLMLALQVRYRKELAKSVAPNYPEQGALFERLVVSALEARGLRVHSTGWSKTQAESIEERVAALADHLGEPPLAGAIERWTAPKVKDGGLDVVCHLPFPDTWGGRPVYFVQCASGEDWKEKRSTPNITLWEKLIDLTTKPRRGIAMPFALLEDEFRREATSDLLALVLDRHRLAAPARRTRHWPSDDLRSALNTWTEPRAKALPRADE
jgi:hypothetical protein